MDQVVAQAERTFGRREEVVDLPPWLFGKALGEAARCSYLAADRLVGELALLNTGEGVTKRRHLLFEHCTDTHDSSHRAIELVGV